MNSIILSETKAILQTRKSVSPYILFLSVCVIVMSFTATKANTVYTWTGNTSSNWTDSTNWNPISLSGGPNSCDEDVIIPFTTISPVILTTIKVGNVQMADHAQLTLKSSLSICQNWAGGTTTYATVIGHGSVVFASSMLQTISGITQMPRLYLDNTFGVSMQNGAILDLFISLDLKAGNFDATSGTLTFKSNAVDSIAFIDNFTQGNNLGTLTGNVTEERYFNGTAVYNQHFLGSPVNSPSLSQFGASGNPGFVSDLNCDETHLSGSSPYGTLFALHEANGISCAMEQWEVITTGSAQNGLGYSYLKIGAGKLSLSGAPNLDNDYSVTGLTNSGWSNTSLQGHNYNSGWQLISNPYLAELNLMQTSAGFDNQAQIWNTEGPYAGSYQPVMMGTNAPIAPFQAFMVHKTAIGGTATFTIHASERVRELSTFYLLPANELKIIATNNSSGMLDQTTVAFSAAATDGFDPQYDAAKIPGAINRHTIFTDNGGMWMSRNIMKSLSAPDTIPMGFEPGSTGTFSFAFNGLNTFDPSVCIYIEDKTMHTLFNVRNGSYTFTATEGDDRNRFLLLFNPAVQIATVAAGCNGSGSIQITQAGSASWNYILTDSNNMPTASGTINDHQPAHINAPAGIYTLTLTDSNNYTVVKSVVVNALPVAVAEFIVSGNSTMQTNGIITLTAQATDAVSYQWNLGNGTTGSGSIITASYSNPGTYIIQLSVENQTGCTATSSQSVSVISPSAISTLAISDNPVIWSSSNTIYVDFTNVPSVNATITIYDILGRTISSEKISSSLLYQRQLDNLLEAYYVVTVANNNHATTKKVLITTAR